MFRCIAIGALVFSLGCLVGCGTAKPTSFDNKDKKDDHEHTHAGGEEDAELPGGKQCHAVLAAHLSKKGDHELEVEFKTMGKDPKPMTIPEKTKVTLHVKRGEEVFDLELKPGPKEERKSDPDGQCSHFEADAKWLKPDDKLTVTLSIEGVAKKVVWVDYDVKKFGHEAD